MYRRDDEQSDRAKPFDAQTYRNRRQRQKYRSLATAHRPHLRRGKFLRYFSSERTVDRETLKEIFKVKSYQRKTKTTEVGTKGLKGLNLAKKIVLVYLAISFLVLGSFGGYFINRFVSVYLNHKNFDKTNLSTVLRQPRNISIGSDGMIASSKGDYFIFHDAAENNYVYYSGNLYRILKVNFDGSVLMISEEPLCGLIYRTEKQSFTESYVYRWLNPIDDDSFAIDNIRDNGIFYNSLYKPEEYLNTQAEFCVLSDPEGNCQQSIKAPVGLLNLDQYLEAGGVDSFINNGSHFWTMSTDEVGDVYSITEDGALYPVKVISYITSNYNYGIRPVIELKSDTKFLHGNGSPETPYYVGDENYVPALGETLLKERYAGEYVFFNDELFRITETNDKYTKLIQVGLIGGDEPQSFRFSMAARRTNMFSTEDSESLAYYLNKTYINTIKQKDLLTKGKSYIGTYSYETDYKYSNLYLEDVNYAIALPKIGELYNNNFEDETGYWCLDVFNINGYMMTVLGANNQLNYVLTKKKRNVKITIFIKPDTKVISGTGVMDDPYQIGR